MSKTGVIRGINGPIVHVKGDPGFTMNEMVYVGHDNLVGEVIGLKAGDTIIQVYEETAGIRPGELVTGTGAPVSVTLAPGILTNIFDGIERPLRIRVLTTISSCRTATASLFRNSIVRCACREPCCTRIPSCTTGRK